MRTGTVSYKLEDLKKGVIIPIGFVGENDFTRVIFDAEEIYKKYPSASVSMKVQPPKGGIYPATVTRDGNTVIWQVKEADVANRGGGELQLTFTDGETKIKTYIAKTDVKRSLTGNGPAPDPVQGWVDNAEEVLDDLEAMDTIAKNAQAGDIGKALSPKTVEDGVVTEWQYIETGGGTEDYSDLENKPSIGGVTLAGDKSLHDLGIAAESAIPDVSGKANLSVVAPAFDQATANDAGSLVTYTDGVVYVLPEGHTAGTTWANTQKTATNIAEQQRLLKNAIDGMKPIAQQSDIGKALILKTIDQSGKPTAFEYGEAGGGSVDPSVVEQKVDAWLDENITNPNSPPLDRSLSSGSAAAPADVAGSIDKKINTLFNPDHTSLFVVGSMNTNDGTEVSSTTRMRTGYLAEGLTAIIPDNGYKFMLFAFKKSNNQYVGAWTGTKFAKSGASWLTSGMNIPATITGDNKLRIIAATENNDTVSLSTDAKHINIIWATDQTLTKLGVSADAKVTGDLIRDIQSNIYNNVTDYEYAIVNKGKYEFIANDFESGSWANTSKTDNTKRLRIKYLIPVYNGTVVNYDNPTLDFNLIVFNTKTDDTPRQTTGWISAGSSGQVTINRDGYMVIILNSESNISVSDYDCTITAVYAVDSVSNPLFFYKTQNQTSIPISTSALSYSDFITNTWEAFRTAFSDNVTRNVLTNDTSDTYPIYEYVVTPSEHYTHTVLVAAGMHGDEYEGFWSLYRIMYFLYTMGYKYEKTRNLLRDTKFIIIPVLNPYGVQNRTRGNSAGVNAHENYDVRWNDNTYSRTGTTPFQYNEAKAVKLALEAHNDIEMFIEFHTDPYDPDKGNYTEVIETSPLIPMAYNITLDERQNLKNEYNYVYPLSKDWVVCPTKKCNSIRYVEEVWNIPALLMETGIGGEAQSGTAKQMNIAFNWYINCMIQAIKTLG